MAIRCSSAAALMAAGFVSLSSLAGPLNPPPGPIGPTAKPLAEIEPRTAINSTNTPGDADSVFKITQPGSYYLTADVAGAAGLQGIEVAVASGVVTIDLNGFALRGALGSLSGVSNTMASAVHVRSGTISGWGGNGASNIRSAQWVAAADNAGAGLQCVSNASIANCTVVRNGSSGRYGIETDVNAVIVDCVVESNGGASGGGGISAGGNSQVRACAVMYNATMLTSGAGYGIVSGSDATVTGCRINGNGAAIPNTGGLFGFTGTRVSSCAVYGNRNFGIRVNSECMVTDNMVGGVAPGTGIRVEGGRGRIEGNHVFTSTVGVQVAGPGNTVVRNSVSGGAPAYDIAAGNDVGPIGTAATATSPWANISN